MGVLSWHHQPIRRRSPVGSCFSTYGMGRHPARLNIVDCFSYACAKALGAPLLFKGDDFAQTDINDAKPAPQAASST